MAQEERTVVVTGAAGIGRGIALVLGEAGVTVYLTDRERRRRCRGRSRTRRAGPRARRRAVPVALDHTDDRAVAALFDRVEAERGGLDLLVANAFGGDADPFASGPFWTLPLELWSGMLSSGVRGHLVV